MKQKYEVVVIFNSKLEEAEVGTELDKVKEVLSKYDGSILHTDRWGVRKLAYEIQKETHGYYVLIVVEAEGSFARELERGFKINENVLRYMTVLKDNDAPDLAISMRASDEQASFEASKAFSKGGDKDFGDSNDRGF